jgi:hypothetical protein
MEPSSRRFTPVRIALIAGGAIAFGVLMALRADVDSRLEKTLVAALAGAFLGFLLVLARKGRAA